MAADSTGKVTSGAPFRAPPATIWNNMIAAGQAVADGKLSSGPPGATRPRATDLLRLKNSSEDVRRKGEILKIEGKVIEAITDENIWLDGIEPTADCRFGILKSPADDGEVITAQVSGVCVALVNVTDASHTFAAASATDYVLQSGGSGPLEILYAPSGTGEMECVVRFGGGGDGAQPYAITQLNESANVAIFRHVNEDWDRAYTSSANRAVTFEAKPAPWNEAALDFVVDSGAEAVEIYTHMMSGVSFTGYLIFAERIGGKLCCTGGATGHLFTAQTEEAIVADASGLIAISILGSGTAIVFALNDTGLDLADGDDVTVEFHDVRQRFIISRKGC